MPTCRNIPALLVLAALAAPSGCDRIVGSGVSASEVRTFAGIDRVHVSGRVAVRVEGDPALAGGPTRVQVTADDNVLPFVMAEQSDGVLDLYLGRRAASVTPITVHVTGGALTQVSHSGSGGMEVAGDFGPTLTLEQDGSGEVRATGSADALALRRSGSGDLLAGGLAARVATVRSSGSGHLELCATERVSGELSGSGDIHVRCRPPEVSIRHLGSDGEGVGTVVLLP